ncbi:MAG: flagellar export chaperone FliS [Planctomycetota bacterium]
MTAATLLARYGTVQMTTSSPGQILVMLYDGLFRFLGEARTAITTRDRARAGERISRSHAILDLLDSTLDPTHAPELCDNLHELYLFCMSRIVTANINQDVTPLDEVLRVLGPLREAWKEAIARLHAEAKDPAGQKT